MGTLSDGTPVHRWTLQRAGVRVGILSYGGIVQDVEAPDRDGRPGNVVLGFDGLDGYLAHPEPFLGALIGRYANRIGGARFILDGVEHVLAPNDGPNSLHGGDRGFDKRVWDVTEVTHGLRLSLVAEDGEEGFPGRLEVTVTYTLDERGALHIAYEAVTDAPTHVNLTNHTYWNLAGSGTAGGHELRVAASRRTPSGPD
ncbi:aldose epimerase family protein, partial [Streptomyces sp. DH12]|uniref:aldose epimerase family protein n=1 Tax=Streptomyces sp. DH12 TaxID=2857010 RepID=UPI001E4E9F70